MKDGQVPPASGRPAAAVWSNTSGRSRAGAGGTVNDDDAVARSHRMLLGLAGRVPDDVLAAARLRLADGIRTSLADPVDRAHSFSASTDPDGPALLDLTGTEQPDPVDRVAVETVARASGARALWRSWRAPAPWEPAGTAPTRVYLLEAALDGAPLARLTAAAMRVLVTAGLESPQFEAYPIGFDLGSYHRLARSSSALLWAHGDRRPLRLARVFDRGGAAGVGFDDNHEILSATETDQIAGYLEGGEPILVTTRTAGDVLAPDRGPVVPLSFRTDGQWIWTETVTYYLREYSLAPDRELLGHIRANGYAAVDVDAAAEHRALAVLLTRA